MNKEEYKMKWHRFQQRYEAIYVVEFKKALQQQVKQYLKTQKVMSVTSEPIYKVLVSLYKTVGPLWAQKTGIHSLPKVQTKSRMPMGFSERIVELMRIYYGVDLLNDAELMTRDSRKYIQQVLSEAAITGASFDEIVRELTTNPNFTAMRARRIARTETVTASNGAAIINAKESGLKLKKEWIAVKDKRTRHNHREVNGSIVSIDDPFNVGGEMMQQPGVRTQDNGLPTSAANVVNCRCTTAFIAQRDSNGRLIRG